MKNIVLGSFLAIAAVTSLPANAAGETKYCDGGAAGDALAAAPAAADGSDFVKVPFTPKCSANVYLVGNDRSATVYTVGSSSIKGKTKFGGSSTGGSVGSFGDCAAKPCGYGDAQSGSDSVPHS